MDTHPRLCVHTENVRGLGHAEQAGGAAVREAATVLSSGSFRSSRGGQGPERDHTMFSAGDPRRGHRQTHGSGIFWRQEWPGRPRWGVPGQKRWACRLRALPVWGAQESTWTGEAGRGHLPLVPQRQRDTAQSLLVSFMTRNLIAGSSCNLSQYLLPVTLPSLPTFPLEAKAHGPAGHALPRSRLQGPKGGLTPGCPQIPLNSCTRGAPDPRHFWGGLK